MGSNKLGFRITYEWLYTQYIILHKSMNQISKEVGITSDTLCRHAKLLNIPIKKKSEYSSRKGMKCSTDHKKKLSESQKRAWDRPGYREFQSKIHIGQPFTLGMKGRKLSKERKELISKSRKGKPTLTESQRKEHSIRMSKSGNPNWKGGISYFPYCELFNDEFKEFIRDKFYRKCVLCNKTEEKIGRRHDVHHIDYNKNSICNGKSWAFVPLCKSCHVKTSNHRFKYFNMLINYWIFNSDILINNDLINFSGDYIVCSGNR